MIRSAAGGDVHEMLQLWEHYRCETSDLRLQDELAWRRWIMLRIAAGDVRVRVSARTITAYAAWQRDRVGSAAGLPQLRIPELYVHPDGRGQHVGSGLLARAIDAARQTGCAEVALVSNVHDQAVQALAIPFGFALIGDELVLPLRFG